MQIPTKTITADTSDAQSIPKSIALLYTSIGVAPTNVGWIF